MIPMVKCDWDEKYQWLHRAALNAGLSSFSFFERPYDRLTVVHDLSPSSREQVVFFKRENHMFFVVNVNLVYQVLLDNLDVQSLFLRWKGGCSIRVLLAELEQGGALVRFECWEAWESRRKREMYRANGWESLSTEEYTAVWKYVADELNFDDYLFSISTPHVKVSFTDPYSQDAWLNHALEADFAIKLQLSLRNLVKPGELVYVICWCISAWTLDVHKKPLDAFSTSWLLEPLSYVDGDPVYIFASDFRFGLLNDLRSPFVTIFGEELVDELNAQKPTLFENADFKMVRYP